MNILICITLIALFVNGLQIVTSDKMILGFVRHWLDGIFIIKTSERVGDSVIYKEDVHHMYYPILYCVRCMPSVWGTAIVFLYMPISVSLFWQLPVILVCSSAAAAVINTLYP